MPRDMAKIQEEIDFLKGQAEFLTGITATHLVVFLKFSEVITTNEASKRQLKIRESKDAIEAALSVSPIEGEQNSNFMRGFNEAKDHYAEFLSALD